MLLAALALSDLKYETFENSHNPFHTLVTLQQKLLMTEKAPITLIDRPSLCNQCKQRNFREFNVLFKQNFLINLYTLLYKIRLRQQSHFPEMRRHLNLYCLSLTVLIYLLQKAYVNYVYYLHNSFNKHGM